MNLIENLRQTTSPIDKVRILKTASELEKKMLYYTYNPYYRYGFSKSFQTNVAIEEEPTPQMFDLLDKLRLRQITGNEAIRAVSVSVLTNGALLSLVCKKDLNCGVSAKLINKAFKNLIPEFNVQLAKEVDTKTLVYPLIAQIKYDGVRVIAKMERNKCVLYTRNGKEINCPQLVKILADAVVYGVVLDGEITLPDGKMEGRTSISGRVNSALHGGILSIDNMVYNVFDSLPLTDFDNNKCIVPYIVRYYSAGQIVKRIDNDIVKLASMQNMLSAEDVNNYYSYVLKLGYEGVILKHKNHLYKFKRSADWVKIKAIKTAELKCEGIIKGGQDTKYHNKIGSLYCTGIVDGKNISVSVGSGLSDHDRGKPLTDFIDKQIEVKYNSIIPSVGEEYTLYLPRYVRIREDK